MMIKKIEEIFVKVTGLTDIKLTEKTRLDKELNVSSLTMIQMVCAIEEEFDIEIPNSAIKKFKTVKDVIKFVEKNI